MSGNTRMTAGGTASLFTLNFPGLGGFVAALTGPKRTQPNRSWGVRIVWATGLVLCIAAVGIWLFAAVVVAAAVAVPSMIFSSLKPLRVTSHPERRSASVSEWI
jgi:hypothetical protein